MVGTLRGHFPFPPSRSRADEFSMRSVIRYMQLNILYVFVHWLDNKCTCTKCTLCRLLFVCVWLYFLSMGKRFDKLIAKSLEPLVTKLLCTAYAVHCSALPKSITPMAYADVINSYLKHPDMIPDDMRASYELAINFYAKERD